MRDNIKREGIYENFTKTIFVNSLFITPIVLLINYSFISKAKTNPICKTNLVKPLQKRKENRRPRNHTHLLGDTMFDWQLRPIIEKNGADYPFQYVKEEIKS